MPWLTTRSWHTTIARDPPDRTTTEWLHQARRYDGAYRASIEDVKNAVTRGYRLTTVSRVRTFHCLAGTGISDHVERTASRRRRLHDMH
jgi:hypothetical protein